MISTHQHLATRTNLVPRATQGVHRQLLAQQESSIVLAKRTVRLAGQQRLLAPPAGWVERFLECQRLSSVGMLGLTIALLLTIRGDPLFNSVIISEL